MKTFRFLFPLFNMKVKRTALCLNNYGSFKRSSTCYVRYVSSDLKNDGAVRKLERYITHRSVGLNIFYLYKHDKVYNNTT